MSTDGFVTATGLEPTPNLTRALADVGIAEPTEVQRQGIGPILAGQDVLLHAGTGSGKTLAYLLPVLQRLRATPGLRAVVFAPGTELALQVLRVADAFKDDDLTTGSAVATTSQRRQRDRVQRSTRLVVGTPDRLLELFASGKLKGVRLLVFDELEPILGSPGSAFLPELLSRSEPRYQFVVASATLGSRSEAFLSRFLGPDLVRVAPADDPLHLDIAHQSVRVPVSGAREVAVGRFLREQRCDRAIVFVSDPGQQAHLFHYLLDHGLTAVTVSRERGKHERQQSLQAFREGRARVLLVTDATARGLDVPGVAWVLHYDLPRSPQVYVHRAGRTGRAGQQGTSVVFVDDRERPALRRLASSLGLVFDPAPRH